MTNAGHDFGAAIRDDTIWKRTKAAAASVSGVLRRARMPCRRAVIKGGP